MACIFLVYPQHSLLTELELIEGCQKKDSKCQYRLFETYAGKMMTLCRRMPVITKLSTDELLQHISPVTSRTQLIKARNLLKTQIENLQKMPGKYA